MDVYVGKSKREAARQPAVCRLAWQLHEELFSPEAVRHLRTALCRRLSDYYADASFECDELSVFTKELALIASIARSEEGAACVKKLIAAAQDAQSKGLAIYFVAD